MNEKSCYCMPEEHCLLCDKNERMILNLPKQRRGFSAMSPEKQRMLAKQGGRAAHQLGKAHEWSKEEAKKMGRKGGLKAQENRLNHVGCLSCHGTKKITVVSNEGESYRDYVTVECKDYKRNK